MITVHAFDAATGERRTVTLDGTDAAEAKALCHALVAENGPVYRAAIFDRMSTRYVYDTDSAWLAA